MIDSNSIPATIKGQSRAYRKALRKIGLRNFPLSGAFHVRTSNGGILLPNEVREYGTERGIVIKNGAKPFWRAKATKLDWTRNTDSGMYSAADGLSIVKVNTKHFMLYRDGTAVCKGTLKVCQGFAQDLLDTEKAEQKASA